VRVLMVSKALVVASYRTKVDEIARLGIDITAVSPNAWIEQGNRIELERDRQGSGRVIVAPIAWNGHFHVHYYPSLGSIIRERQPDIVHMDEEPFNLATFLACRSAQRWNAHFVFFTWQNIVKSYPPPFSMMQRYVFGRTAHALAGSKACLTVLRENGYTGPASEVPQFGVDVEAFSPGEHSHRARFTVGFLGRLVPEKGIEDLIEACRQLRFATNLIIAGDGILATSLPEGNVNERLTIERHSRMPSSEVPSFLRRLDVLVLPSRTTAKWQEQFGRVLIEAMACGIPVIGSNSGEIPNVVGEGGLIFPEGDIGALAAALTSLHENQALRHKLGDASRHRAVSVYSQGAIAAQTVEAYGSVVGSRFGCADSKLKTCR
jgi:glycosyltransferase involved in cell wall biosynthesis